VSVTGLAEAWTGLIIASLVAAVLSLRCMSPLLAQSRHELVRRPRLPVTLSGHGLLRCT
jgi:hypothetical protein